MTHPGDPVHPAPHATLLLSRASCDTPSSRDRIRERLRTSRSNASTGITAAEPTTADSKSLSSARAASSSSAPCGRGRRHGRPTPAPPPRRHAPPASRRTQQPAEQHSRRLVPSGVRRRSTGSPPVHRILDRRDGKHAARSVRRRRPTSHEPAATSPRVRPARCGHSRRGRRRPARRPMQRPRCRAYVWRMALTPVGLYVVSGGGAATAVGCGLPGYLAGV